MRLVRSFSRLLWRLAESLRGRNTFRQYVSRLVKVICESLAKHSPQKQRKKFYYQSFWVAINEGAVITDSSGSPTTFHSPASPAGSSATTALLVR